MADPATPPRPAAGAGSLRSSTLRTAPRQRGLYKPKSPLAPLRPFFSRLFCMSAPQALDESDAVPVEAPSPSPARPRAARPPPLDLGSAAVAAATQAGVRLTKSPERRPAAFAKLAGVTAKEIIASEKPGYVPLSQRPKETVVRWALSLGGVVLAEGLMLGVALGVAAGLGLREAYHWQLRRRRIRACYMAMMTHLDQTLLKKLLGQLPPWVQFRAWTDAEWLNGFLLKAWPFYDRALAAPVQAALERVLERHRPGFLRQISFEEFTFGAHPLLITGVRCRESSAEEVLLEIDLRWGGAARLVLAAELMGLGKRVRGAALRVKLEDVQAFAKVLIRFRPILPNLQKGALGALTVSLSEAPRLFFHASLPVGMDLFLTASIVTWLETVLKKKIARLLVWPQRLVVPLLPESTPLPERFGGLTLGDYVRRHLALRAVGLLRVSVMEATVLRCKEIAGKSTPYFTLAVRPEKHMRTSVHKVAKAAKGQSGPTLWNESFDLLVEEPAAQPLRLEAFCENKLGWGAESRVGAARVPYSDLAPGERRVVEAPLGMDPSWGSVKLELAYSPFDATPDAGAVAGGSAGDDAQWLGVFFVKLVKGRNLPQMDGMLEGLSDPFVVLDLAGKKFTSRTIYDNLDPVFNEAFEFVGVRETDWLQLEVFDRDLVGADFMGRVLVNMYDVVAECGRNGKTVTKSYPLQSSPQDGKLLAKRLATQRGELELELAYQLFKQRT